MWGVVMNGVFKERWIEILKILLNSTQPMTIREMETKLNVSNRTIRNDLDEIDIYLKENKYGSIVRKPRVGVWIEIDHSRENELRKMFNEIDNYGGAFLPEERQRYILKELLKCEKPITMEKFAEKLYVSRITILKDINKIEDDIKKYNLSILRKQNHGVEIIGSENDFRKLATEVFKEDRDKFSRESLNFIRELLLEAERQMDFFFTDEAMSSLIFHISISVERVKQSKSIKLDCEKKDEIKSHREYSIAKRIAEKLESEFLVCIPEDEICYITMHILGSKIQRDYRYDDERLLSILDKDVVKLSMEIIELIGSILSVDLSNDKALLTGLALHLEPTVNRLKYDLVIKNPLLPEIKKNYPSIFGASWASSVLFEKYYGYKVNEDEIGYIAIHIGAALERQKINTKAIIVCSSGVGTSQLVSVRLGKALPDLDIVDVISVHEVENIENKNFDIVISTVPFEYSLKPVIQISPFVEERDIEEIKKWIKNIEGIRKPYKKILDDALGIFFSPSLIFPKLNLKTREEVINVLGDYMLKYGYIEPAFLDEVFEREKITSTAIGKGVAIPHGNQRYVKRPVIALAILEKPVQWGESTVDLVFMLALKEESRFNIKKFFSKFYEILGDEEVLNDIRKLSSSEEIYGYLSRR